MLTDDTIAEENNLSNAYSADYVGMAKAYREYLEGAGIIKRLDAKETGKDITITKEGMEPHFVLNGIEYRAKLWTRAYRYGVIQRADCMMLHPELAEPVGVEENRKIFMQWSIRLGFVWIAIIIALIGILLM